MQFLGGVRDFQVFFVQGQPQGYLSVGIFAKTAFLRFSFFWGCNLPQEFAHAIFGGSP